MAMPQKKKVTKKSASKKEEKRSIWKKLGPGFITGASDDDPSGIATYAQTGAMFGYSQLWLALFTLPFMVTIQEMCGRIGMVTGKGLASVLKENYGKTILWFAVILLGIANTVNVGADLGAMASASELVTGIPFTWSLIVFTALSLGLQIAIPYHKYAPILKFFAFSLLAYVITVILVDQDWTAIARSTFIPSFTFTEERLMNVVAVLGTTIAPYLFFWQANEEVEEEIEKGWLSSFGSWIHKKKITKEDIRDMRHDTAIGMTFSNFVMFFIIATSASTLARAGITNIETAHQAAEALTPLAGKFAGIVFSLGIIGTGLLTVPVLAGASAYAFAEAMNWKEGLSLDWKRAQGFYAVIAISMLIGVALNYVGIPPFRMLYLTAILNGVLAPPLIVLIVLMAGNKKIMGKAASGKISKTVGWIAATLMGAAAIALLYTFVR